MADELAAFRALPSARAIHLADDRVLLVGGKSRALPSLEKQLDKQVKNLAKHLAKHPE